MNCGKQLGNSKPSTPDEASQPSEQSSLVDKKSIAMPSRSVRQSDVRQRASVSGTISAPMVTSLETAVDRTLTFIGLASRRHSVFPDYTIPPGGEESPQSLAGDINGGALTSTESQPPVSNKRYIDDVSKLTNLRMGGMEAMPSMVCFTSASADAAGGGGRAVDLEGDVGSQPGQ